MQIIVGYDKDEPEAVLPAVFDVCPVCQGKGTHVHPGVDSHGISIEEMYDDPDFAEEYFSGFYDVQCNECDGKRVVLFPDEKHCKEEDLKILQDHEQEQWEMDEEMEQERRMGC